MSGHGKKPTDQGTLTSWRRQREGLVRTPKETERGTLTSWRWQREELGQDMERNWLSKAHSPTGDSRGRDLSGHRKKRPTEVHSRPGDSRGRDLSGHRKKPTDQGALTSWRRQREGLGQDTEKTSQARCTHQLETAEGETCQDTERNQPSKVHSRPGNSGGRDSSGHRKNPTDRGTLTSWRRQREGLVRTWKETNQRRHTHSLETAEGGSRSGHGKKLTNRGALTNWRRRRDLVGTRKETDRLRRTHFLKTAEGGACQDTEGNQPSGRHGHSHTEECKGEGKLVRGKRAARG